MGRFAMQCPNCQNYVTAYNGLAGLFNNRIKCHACGTEINVRAERMKSVVCPHCKNTVVYDQGTSNPKCPVCNHVIEPGKGGGLVSLNCPQCGIGFEVVEGTHSCACPICDMRIDVDREVQKANYKRQGGISHIKYEGDNNTFVWKHPIEDFNSGSKLTVHESQEAIFFRDGSALDLFGPGEHILETRSLPLMDNLYKMPTQNTRSFFHSEVYFINMSTLMGIKWGTDTKIRLFDPMTGMHVGIGASGEFNIRVINSRKVLLKLVGTTNGLEMKPDAGIQGTSEEGGAKNGYGSDIPSANRYFRGLIKTRVKSFLANAIKNEGIGIFEIDAHLDRLSEALRDSINQSLQDYGLMMPEFYIMRVITPEDDPYDDEGNPRPEWESWMKAKSLFADRYTHVEEQRVAQAVAEAEREKLRVQEQTEAQMKIIRAQGDADALRIQKAAEAEAYRMQAEAEAAEMRMKGYTYQQETSRQIGMEAMKNGLTGNGSGGSIGDIAGLGLTLGAMGGVINMTRDAMQPAMNSGSEMGQSMSESIMGTWNCPKCGKRRIASKFCPECGTAQPQPATAWNCPNCGAQGITSKCCPECGFRRPEPIRAWTCPNCGIQGLTSKCCPECGTKRPEEPTLWNCPECGKMGITSKFCPECGHRKGE